MWLLTKRRVTMADKISKEMTFFELMRTYPESVKVLQKNNLGCIGCMGAQNESLEQGARAHGLDIETLLKELNAAIG
jgi:hybrid cluster-associated redox disulfide protein